MKDDNDPRLHGNIGAPARAAGLRAIEEFTPYMGQHYARRRNYDLGPGQHRGVSRLSPYLRRRIVLEEEVIGAAIGAHGAAGAEKFIQEVVWRGYFKGWLERRPLIWAAYRDGLLSDLAQIEGCAETARRLQEAETGATGLACFDAWVRELLETGYLHNHARMWFASIWIFTLGLPWRIGADFFLRHLIDGDPASNTLGWRWVAGLHTRGKAYHAQAWNIEKFTAGRFAPAPGDLAGEGFDWEAEEPEPPAPAAPPRAPETARPDLPTALLLTEEDCDLGSAPFGDLQIVARGFLLASHLRSPRAVAPLVASYERGALEDSARQSGEKDSWTDFTGRGADDLAAWAKAAGAKQIVTSFVPQGPLADWRTRAAPALAAAGVPLCEWQRPWDRAVWAFATAGFFKVKARIPQILQERALL